jgi:hypothetical protein
MAWQELFSTDIGLLSVFTIAFIIGMAGYLYRFAKRHIAEDESTRMADSPGARGFWKELKDAETDPGVVAVVHRCRDCRDRVLHGGQSPGAVFHGGSGAFLGDRDILDRFLCLWLICAGSSLVTLFFQRTSEEINRSDLD